MSFSYHAPLISSHLGQSLNLSLSFVDLDTFEVYWPVILKNVPQFGFIWYFLMITLWVFCKNTRGDMPFSVHCARRLMTLQCISGCIRVSIAVWHVSLQSSELTFAISVSMGQEWSSLAGVSRSGYGLIPKLDWAGSASKHPHLVAGRI